MPLKVVTSVTILKLLIRHNTCFLSVFGDQTKMNIIYLSMEASRIIYSIAILERTIQRCQTLDPQNLERYNHLEQRINDLIQQLATLQAN